MRILIVNTAERIGGAAIAARRLMDALNNNGVKAKMLVRDKQTEQLTVCALPPSILHRVKFVWERIVIWAANRFSKKNLFYVDIANTGTDITRLPEFREADVIHLHWVNQGFLSLHDLQRIFDSGKPVVWTLHDMWPFTGICHYSDDCERYRTACHHCPLLRQGGDNDLAARTFRRKAKLWQRAPIRFVACSRWLERLARQSRLIEGHSVCAIPNAINGGVFHPGDRVAARKALRLPADRQLLLFGSLKVTDERKGFRYLLDACRRLHEQRPELAARLDVVVVGRQAEQQQALFPFPTHVIDYIGDEQSMASLYRAVDVFVIPSLQDNLPNTIAEAMSCGTPCVGFAVGGIPEMIGHRTDGYLARYRDADDLAEGIAFVLEDEERHSELGRTAARRAATTYGESGVAMKYIRLYNAASTQEQA